MDRWNLESYLLFIYLFIYWIYTVEQGAAEVAYCTPVTLSKAPAGTPYKTPTTGKV
jgi:hypothetical protein